MPAEHVQPRLGPTRCRSPTRPPGSGCGHARTGPPPDGPEWTGALVHPLLLEHSVARAKQLARADRLPCTKWHGPEWCAPITLSMRAPSVGETRPETTSPSDWPSQLAGRLSWLLGGLTRARARAPGPFRVGVVGVFHARTRPRARPMSIGPVVGGRGQDRRREHGHRAKQPGAFAPERAAFLRTNGPASNEPAASSLTRPLLIKSSRPTCCALRETSPSLQQVLHQTSFAQVTNTARRFVHQPNAAVRAVARPDGLSNCARRTSSNHRPAAESDFQTVFAGQVAFYRIGRRAMIETVAKPKRP